MTRHDGYLNHDTLPTSLKVDVLVIGLGAGGSMAFHDLAQRGHNVLAMELGERFESALATRREESMMPQLFAEGGARATEDMAIRVLQGKGVGGSTLHNTNLCKRLPDDILQHWVQHHGLHELARPQLTQDFEDVEAMLGVHAIPDDRVNANNRIMARGVDALGWRGGRLAHNRDGCKQSGFCELGCPNNGKQNAAKVLIPPALDAGGRIVTRARVERLHARNGVITHATAQVTRKDGTMHQVIVRARQFVVAASATSSAALIKASNLPDPYRLAGTNLHMHPGAFVIGLFDEDVESWRGVPQATECTEFLSFDGSTPDQRVWLVAGSAHPGGSASMLPGFGAPHTRLMRGYKHAAALIAMIHDHSSGRVLPSKGEHLQIHYKMDRADWAQIELGLKQGARIFLAAGAKEVVLPLNPMKRIRTERDIEAISAADIKAFSPPLVAVHPMSTLWMGSDPRSSVVNPFGRHHHVSNLSVADGSLFPTSIGGPPQISIYTLGRHVARAVDAEL